MKARTIISTLAVMAVLAGSAGFAQAYNGYHNGNGQRYSENYDGYNDGYGYGGGRGYRAYGNCPYADGGRGYYGYQGKDFTEKEIAQIEKMREEHFNKMRALGSDYRSVRRELNAIKYNPNVKPDQLESLAAELNSIEKKMDAERDAFAAAMKKEFDIDIRAGYGMRHHRMNRSCPF